VEPCGARSIPRRTAGDLRCRLPWYGESPEGLCCVHVLGRARVNGTRKLFYALLDRISYRSRHDSVFYRLAQAIVDRIKGDNSSDPVTNGELAFLRNNLHDADVVFDVGANAGQWAQMCLRLNPRIHLHCFEPSRFTFRELERVGLPPNVRLNHCGLGAARDTSVLRIFEEGSGLNSLYVRTGVPGKAQEDKTETIELETLDGYCATNGIRYVDLVKVDVEGHELQVLKGAERMLRGSNIGLIQFEYGGCNIDARVFLRDIFDFVTTVSPKARFFKLLPRRIVEVAAYTQKLETLQYSNYVVGIAKAPRGF